MRNAFTMIELIFVIVILGILATVAIPRLSATRDDAKIVRMAHAIMSGAGEIASYAIANGKTEDNLSGMSNNITSLINSGEATENGKIVSISMDGVDNCVSIEVNTTASSEVLNISLHNSGISGVCDGLHSAVHANEYPMQIRGGSVVR